MRIAIAIVFMLAPGGAACQSMSELARELQAELGSQELRMYPGYREDRLRFDSELRLKRDGRTACPEVFAQVKVDQVKLTRRRVELKGMRRNTGADASPITIEIDAGRQQWSRERLRQVVETILMTREQYDAALQIPGGVPVRTPDRNAPILYHTVDGPVYEAAGNVRPAKAVQRPDPEYNDRMRSAQINAVAVARFVVERDGRPSGLRSLAFPKGYGVEEAVERTLTRWVFEPATLDGEPVRSEVNADFKFCMY